ncbi:hypothetical protein, partial [Paenibacillus sp. N3.4]|uniref:hypothetical protein n=1 Tax=Paenibacillus sp. N3.4 TaxID=2603222 RepID=UPI001C9C6170
FSLAVSTFSVLTASPTDLLPSVTRKISFTAHHSAHSLIFLSYKHVFRAYSVADGSLAFRNVENQLYSSSFRSFSLFL